MGRIYSICRHICGGCVIPPVEIVTPGGGIFGIWRQSIVEPAGADAYNVPLFQEQLPFEFPDKSPTNPKSYGYRLGCVYKS